MMAVVAVWRADAAFRVSSDFEGGSARVLGLDAATQTVHISPGGDPKRGMPVWWFFRLDDVDPNKPVVVEVVPQEKERAPTYVCPDRATFSADQKTWKHTAVGQKRGNQMTYRVEANSSTVWLAWGPPFTPNDAAAFTDRIAKAHPFAKPFTLCRSREGRAVPALEIAEGSKPAGERSAIWVHARQHGWECGGSWVGVGFVEWLVSDEEQAAWLRQNAEIFFVPIMDVDHVATGDGGKDAEPQDHNRDWTDSPHWAEVAAAQKRILTLAKEGRMNVFLDLHNPSPGLKQEEFYVVEKAYVGAEAPSRQQHFMALARAAFGEIKEVPAKPPTENPEIFNAVSVPWVFAHGNPNTMGFCVETPWNTSDSTMEGYRAVGQKLGRMTEQLLREERK